jgi:hypothetical protein
VVVTVQTRLSMSPKDPRHRKLGHLQRGDQHVEDFEACRGRRCSCARCVQRARAESESSGIPGLSVCVMGKLQATAFDYLPLPEGVVIQIENGWVKQIKYQNG